MLFENLLRFVFGPEFDVLTPDEREALYRDLVDLMYAEDLNVLEAVETLARRISPASLRSYVRTLIADERRRTEVKR